MNADQARELRRPLPASAVGFRLDAKQPDAQGNYRCVVYIDARVAAERLTTADPSWSEVYEAVPGVASKNVVMRCTVTLGTATRQGYGEGSDIKSAESDSLKRAAVKYGVGAYLYALPPFRVTSAGVWTRKDGAAGGLTKAGVVDLRKQYTKWITHKEFTKYGEPVDYATLDDGGERHATDASQEPSAPPVQPARRSGGVKPATVGGG